VNLYANLPSEDDRRNLPFCKQVERLIAAEARAHRQGTGPGYGSPTPRNRIGDPRGRQAPAAVAADG